MAMYRRPPGVEPPTELFEFRLEEWQAPDDLDREAAFQVGRRRGVPGLLSIRIRH